MMNAKYIEGAMHCTDYTQCIDSVTSSLGDFADCYDIDAIIDEAFDFVNCPDFIGWQCSKDEDEYWDIVESNDMRDYE